MKNRYGSKGLWIGSRRRKGKVGRQKRVCSKRGGGVEAGVWHETISGEDGDRGWLGVRGRQAWSLC